VSEAFLRFIFMRILVIFGIGGFLQEDRKTAVLICKAALKQMR